jgi:hypothetical protein
VPTVMTELIMTYGRIIKANPRVRRSDSLWLLFERRPCSL